MREQITVKKGIEDKNSSGGYRVAGSSNIFTSHKKSKR